MYRIKAFILSSVSFAALAASPAIAQQTTADTAPPQTLTTEQEVKSGQNACEVTNGQPVPADCAPATTNAIVVTGTRIRSPNLTSPLPVTSVGGQEFFQTGNVSIGDKLAELPQIAGTFTQANSTRFLGTGGLNLLDLRGLGTQRTLVLVNGRRHVGGDVLNTGVSVDVNTIPTDLIDRVDIVTGGNSAVYGSDAIAGVVNFVLKDHFDGVQLRGQGGRSKYGDANSYFVSGLVGKNFAEGRGNVAVNIEYARRNQSYADKRSFFTRDLYVNDNAGGDPNVPDELLNPDFRSASFSNTGTVRFGGPGIGGPGTGLDCGLDTQGDPYFCPYIFQPDGSLVQQTGTRVGVGPNGQFVGGNGEDFVHGHQIQLTPQLDRYNVNLVGHFEVSPAFVPFVEGTYSRTDSVSTGNSGPAFIISSAGQGALGDLFGFFGSGPNARNRERIRIDNPYLTDQARGVICDARAASGLDCAGDATFGLQEGLLGLGNRIEKARRETYRIVGGVRGDIGSNWNYEVSLNYGQLKEKTRLLGNLNTQRMLLAMDAVRDPATGQIVCRSQIDPSAAFGGNTYGYTYYYGTGAPEAGGHYDPNYQQRLQKDVAACVPVNVLGGQFTDAQKAYLLEDTTAVGKTSQFDATAFISGDTGKWFSLPGGPVGIVLGAEYREDNLYYNQAEDVQLGYTFYNSIPTFQAPKSKVKEVFGEIRLPILKDVPLFHELEVSGAGRISDYNLGKTGTVKGWNANLLWSPVNGLRLRANYGHSIRAPNQGELYTPFGQNFSSVNDPCDTTNINANAQRTANCIAAGVPAGGISPYSDSLPYLSGGNPDLQAETSNSITLGGVVTPRFLPGFSMSVDYYDIKVKNVISSVGAQFILNSCYDAPSLDNAYCAFFQRATGTQVGHDALAHGIINNSLHVGGLNFASLVARGIDTEIAYRHQIGSLGRLDTKLNWTHSLERTDFTDPSNPKLGDRQLSEIGFPQDSFNWNTSLQHGRFTLGYQMRYIGKMIVYDPARGVGEYEDFYPFEGNPPARPDLFDRKWYPSRFYHDVRLAMDIGPKFNLYVGADNVTNTKPPYNLTGLTGGNATGNGAGESIYDNIGRFYYAGFVAKLGGGSNPPPPPPLVAAPPPPPPVAPATQTCADGTVISVTDSCPAPPPPPPPPPPTAPERG